MLEKSYFSSLRGFHHDKGKMRGGPAVSKECAPERFSSRGSRFDVSIHSLWFVSWGLRRHMAKISEWGVRSGYGLEQLSAITWTSASLAMGLNQWS